ncbi:MAG: hypothetical protein QOI63_17 [Thermoplasmata archaeon]|jgi:hypothetical protein|nr:hypothetical protein [Thermoplasmata archaeon]
MRGLTLVALLVVGALALSGCSSKSDSSSSTSKSGTHTGTGVPTTNTTTQAPNVPPVVVVHSTNSTGVASNVTFVRGSLTFSAAGSSDPDGDGLSAVAIVAQDSNRTYPPGVLFAGGKFTPVTYTFDRPGIVNVTVSGIDVRGDLTTVKTQVFVDEVQTVKSNTLNIPAGAATSSASDCTGAFTSGGVPSEGSNVLDPTTHDGQPINVVKGATYLTGDLQSQSTGSGNFAFCGPDGKAVSPDDKDGHAASDKPLPPTKGTETYSVSFVASEPQTTMYVKVVIHYEPKAAAAA